MKCACLYGCNVPVASVGAMCVLCQARTHRKSSHHETRADWPPRDIVAGLDLLREKLDRDYGPESETGA